MSIPAYMTAFITSYWGMYVVQSVFHSVIASVLAECALLAWNIRAPHAKQWFRLIVILLPIASFPVYQFAVPRRGDIYFRLSSLLDSNRWFFIEKWDVLPVLMFFAVIVSLTTLIFMLQEFFPILSSMLDRMRAAGKTDADEVDPALRLKAEEALQGLPLDAKHLDIFHDDDLSLFSSTGLKPMVYISTGLIGSFSVEHLHVAFAHEIAHIQRSRRPVLIMAYLMRMLLFYNPVAMIEFRRLAHEEEKVCDDIAIELTGKPEALSEAIEMLRPSPGDYDSGTGRESERLVSAIEYYSHDVLLKSRVVRIGKSEGESPAWGLPLLITVAFVICVNYFIV